MGFWGFGVMGLSKSQPRGKDCMLNPDQPELARWGAADNHH